MIYRPEINNIAKQLGMEHNVSIRVIDQRTGKCVQQHVGHNSATNSMITGIAHYLVGDGILNQGVHMLNECIPRYISLGTMGLHSQDSDENGLPTGIGDSDLGNEELNFISYMEHCPSFGADGYDLNDNNSRRYAGIGPMFPDRPDSTKTIDCELISASFPRSLITFRDIVPETQSELKHTIDVVFSAMISTGGLRQFREEGKDYIYITEAGLWSRKTWESTQTNGDNGLLAGYRIIPPDSDNWDMKVPANRQILKENIIRVGINQVVQIVWKIQLGGLDDFGGLSGRMPIVWNVT